MIRHDCELVLQYGQGSQVVQISKMSWLLQNELVTPTCLVLICALQSSFEPLVCLIVQCLQYRKFGYFLNTLESSGNCEQAQGKHIGVTSFAIWAVLEIWTTCLQN